MNSREYANNSVTPPKLRAGTGGFCLKIWQAAQAVSPRLRAPRFRGYPLILACYPLFLGAIPLFPNGAACLTVAESWHYYLRARHFRLRMILLPFAHFSNSTPPRQHACSAPLELLASMLSRHHTITRLPEFYASMPRCR